MHNIIVLGGSPGSGKTAIASLLAERGFTRISIDDFYRAAPRNPDIQNWFDDPDFLDAAYAMFKDAILKNVSADRRLVIESTGVSKRWKEILMGLTSRFPDQVLTIYLDAPKKTLMKRLEQRNRTDYPIKVTEERLDAFLERGANASAEYQHVVNASKPLNDVLESVTALI